MYGKNIDMSMRELGDRVELTEGTIQRYETGQIKGVDINLLNKISETLNISPALEQIISVKGNSVYLYVS